MPDCSVDSIVTDPPYGLSFMNKRWDYDVPGVEVWAECLRVLKSGGHLLSFAGTRTQHRMAVRIEDAGFEIRDMIAWVYGSGFPKSLDVSKAIDKRGGVRAGFVEFRDAVKEAMKRKGVTRSQLCRQLGNFMCDHYLTYGSQPAIPSVHDYRIIRDAVGLGADWDHLFLDEAKREVIGQKLSGIHNREDKHRHTIGASFSVVVNITAPATEAAQQWNGWGTALKPAIEPITVARKPIIGTVAENVLQHGTGALNIDGCRIGSSNGRWPANLIHDGSENVIGLLQDSARFFYCAKANKADRGEANNHPTVKPTDLMRYLCRLVTPPNGIVLDPFNGSGSTGCAAILEGFQYIGIERETEYIAISEKRIQASSDQVQKQSKQLTLL
jgi:DNA modification methylase